MQVEKQYSCNIIKCFICKFKMDPPICGNQTGLVSKIALKYKFPGTVYYIMAQLHMKKASLSSSEKNVSRLNIKMKI